MATVGSVAKKATTVVKKTTTPVKKATATAPTFSGPPTSYSNYNPSKPAVVVVTPKITNGAVNYSQVGTTNRSVTAPAPAPQGPPLAYSQAPGGTANPFSTTEMSAAMYNPALKQPSLADVAAGVGPGNNGNIFESVPGTTPSTPQPSPTITNGAVDYNNIIPATPPPSNQDITRTTNTSGYPGMIVGFNRDGTPIYDSTNWDVVQQSKAPQGTTGLLPPLAYSTPPGSTVPPWEYQYPKVGDLEVPEPPAASSDGGDYAYYGGGGGGGDYGGYASSMGLFNWRIGL